MPKSFALLSATLAFLLSGNCFAQKVVETSDSLRVESPESMPKLIACENFYKHHLQGVCIHDSNVYWSFTTDIVKTDLHGNVLNAVVADNHQGDLCFQDNELFVAVNLGKFNSPKGDADSWVYVFSAHDLSLKAKYKLPEMIYGAGGIAIADGHFFVVGGLPDEIEENYIYEYDRNFKFIQKHTLPSGHTHLGIQTVEFAGDKWWFGCYGSPSVLLTATKDFKQVKRYSFDAALGIVSLAKNQFYVAKGLRDKSLHGGQLMLAAPDDKAGLRFASLVD